MAAGDRSKKLQGRIRGALKRGGGALTDVLNKEITDALSAAQKRIFADVNQERMYSLDLVVNQKEYPLLSGDLDIDDPSWTISESSGKDIFRTVKEFITPTTWTVPLQFISNMQWDALLKTALTDAQPIYATIFGRVLVLEPAPSVAETLKLWAILKGPENDIDYTHDPELSDEFDDALVSYALYQLTNDKSFYEVFIDQRNSAKKSSSKSYLLQKPQIFSS